MHLAIGISLAALLVAASLAVYVASRHEKTELHGLLLALLGVLICWSAGAFARFSVTTLEGLEAALRLVFLGVFATPPLFLLVAVRHTRAVGWLERRSAWALVGLPSLAAYLALLTNDAHHLVVREMGFTSMEAGGLAWAGPVFWAFLGWAYLLTAGAALLYLNTARRLALGLDRRRGVVLAAAALIPSAVSTLYVFQLVPLRFDLTPASLIASILLISVAVFRYQLLESLPLARRDVIEQLHEGVVIADASGLVLDLNPAAAEMLGREPGALRGAALARELAAPAVASDRQAVFDALDTLVPSDAPRVIEIGTLDGRRIELSLASVGTSSGHPTGAFAVLRDRTAQHRSERDERQSLKLQTVATLISGVAHEVNNPLAFIRANLSEIHRLGETVEQVRETSPGDKLTEELADLRSIAEETLDGIERIERIVTDMRRLGSPRDQRFAPLDANEVVRDALRLSNLSRDSGIEVREKLSEELPVVEGSAESLVQVVLNLLLNARAALGGSGTVWLETRRVRGRVEILVRDDGPGIPEAVRERIFDPFFTTKDPDAGTGLGLTIALDIVRDHRGSLEHRQPAGGGCTFAVCLPARA